MSLKRAFIKQLHGIALAGRTDSNHWVPMDGPAEFSGNDAGTRPKELILLALAGCTASDVITILQKKRAPLHDLTVDVTAEQTDEHPQVYKSIHLAFVVRGDGIRPADVERAIELSETKYCAVNAMLRPSVTITHSYRIEPVTVATRA